VSDVDPQTPVLVGVGTASENAEASELMTLALDRAGHDAGAPALLGAIDRIAVPQGSWAYRDPARLAADAVGAPQARTYFGQVGAVSQQLLITEALQAIASGHCRVAVVLGGEARGFARHGGTESRQAEVAPDVVVERQPEFVAAPEIAVALTAPVQQYAMIENALGHALGEPVAPPRSELAAVWARFNTVAQHNPLAAFPAPLTATELETPGLNNRRLAFPYNKWHASQWTVDQAAALLLCSAEVARAYGVPTDRWVFPLVGLDSQHTVSLSQREHLHTWPGMAVLGVAASARIGRALDEVELAEVYSCFPAAVRVQQRELGLPSDGTPTVTGGMAFAGGPFNNFVYQATAAMVGLLRQRPEAQGLVTTVSGLLTKPGLAVWSATPDGRPPLLADLSEEVAKVSARVPVLGAHQGPATVLSYTVTPEGASPARVVVIGQDPDGRRCVATSEDPGLVAAATNEGLIGTVLGVEGTTIVSG
jgi:acetyl-CoA C-acetyltransferase